MTLKLMPPQQPAASEAGETRAAGLPAPLVSSGRKLILNKRYEVLKTLENVNADIHMCTDIQTGKTVAVKEFDITRHARNNPSLSLMLEREIRAGSGLKHENITMYYATFEGGDGRFFLVRE
jgi:hypothetical protein